MEDPCLRTKNSNFIEHFKKLSVIDTAERKIDNSWKVKTIGIFVSKFVLLVAVASFFSSSHWIPVKNLGGCSLFVGCNQTFSLHHTFAPEIRLNYIYFIDHCETCCQNTLIGM
ncbi:hypothetical protein IEQ34_005912 [Dendrobium chrysotoxum]|uniref:KIB1-4 beta-propeller domain-containing protein n=1 Tax=Dendrobium chrysotoxum TaxID=161865 RepID=A0AAV7GWC4_DENCH|nr:hypothetical protein IEQ34_005912 [Dendrobium chrysotoxum]